ncbi:MAG: hypothetical protein HY235_25520 [Acidobacteria bacterium]|nr:hypothetical protein [Acidobacteriota bacterium]
MNLRFVMSAVLTAVFAISALAADVTGKWKYSFTTPNGDTRESVLNLKADGSKLTGAVESARGNVEIKDGTISGDQLSFSVVRNFGGNEVTIKYKGKVEGDTMKLTMNFGDNDIDITAKRLQ